jgi:hypothetical protein
MIRSMQMAAVLIAAMGHCLADSRPAASKDGADSTAGRVVQGVLAAERDGSVANRARRLRSAVRSSPQFAPAQWHSGRVKMEREWLSVEKSIPRLAGDKTLQEYRALRAKTPKTPAGQMELAAWCLKHKLYPQQRAHLTAALEINPNHAAARKALGHVRMGPFWISRRELEQRRKDAVQAAKDLKRWAPTVKSIRDALTSGSRLRYRQGLKRLKAIDDPAAIPAIELGLAYQNPHLALPVIDYLSGISHQDATMALARLAIFSQLKSTRKVAAGKLKPRKLEHFVPQLLSMTATPLRSRRMLYLNGNGSLLYRHVYLSETQSARRMSVFDHRHVSLLIRLPAAVTPTTSLQGADSDSSYPLANAGAVLAARGRKRNDATQLARELAYRRQAAAEVANEAIAELNGRVAALLSVVSGKQFDNDARKYWKWWDDYAEVWSYGEKPGYVEYHKSETLHIDVTAEFPSADGKKCSCLVAGTPVWTDRGPVAIDKVQIGDRVLSQNVETGELAYKPVLKTTVRPKRPLIALEIGPRTVRMTGGHPFWVPGKGWVKARNINEGMAMHDVTGTTAVRPVGTAKPEPTYNLIVADFHTYFVGETKVLSHDNTPIEPTNALVPGLLRTAGEKAR